MSGINNDELVKLFLYPEFIGKGYGSKILLDLAENESIKRIDVNTQNDYAKNFYLTYDFEIESEGEVDSFGKPYPITHLNKK
ncbi:hypothetical protein [Enterococcus sp. DIV0086]|uniref:hypothetical protein n=1 Tax=Enterococcus sp. DIV0086 TaxID=2774655 RepID=UPI003D2B6969